MSKNNDLTPEEPSASEQAPQPLDRRSFLGAVGKLAVTTAVVGAAAEQGLASVAKAAPVWPGQPAGYVDYQLVKRNYRVRIERATANFAKGVGEHRNNGDEARYPNKIGSDTRGLPHNTLGEVDLKAWATLIRAIETQDPADFERITLAGTRKLAQPIGTLALNLIGTAASQYTIPPPPALAGAERAAEAVESYWQSLLRDVPLHQYRNDTSHTLVLAAAAELNGLTGYTGPRDASGRVTPELLFRGTARYLDKADPSNRSSRHVSPPGVNVGPYISQFILRDVPYGVQYIPGQLKTQVAGSVNDFLTNYDEWLANQDGRPVTRSNTLDGTRRYLSTGRDLAEYAHGGAPAFWAAAQLLGVSKAQGGFGAPLAASNPYLSLTKSSSGAATFGLAHIQGYLPFSSSREIRATYWHKWFVHRNLRPEAFGGLVHNQLTGRASYPLHEDILGSEALDRSFDKFGTYLLSSAYPEGAPNHASYPGGASSIGAVNATILKAFFDENYLIPDPVQPDPNDPTRLIPYVGPPLTVGGEINKLATNLGQGRNWAGIHWRSDAAGSLPLAEEVAISILRDEKATFREPFTGFSFTRFDGSTVTI